MECPRCHNTNVNKFYKINNRYYCRNCIRFSRVYIDEYASLHLSKQISHNVYYRLPFELSSMQKKISETLKVNYIHHKNSIVLAVCGSGKTEIVFDTIAYALSQGDKVCFCTPRKEICKELYQRFIEHFQYLDISLIYGGHLEKLDSQFIICTTHQLYRFEKAGFHLIIIDEVDAFPFYKNEVLQEIFNRCIKGNYIKMSATVDNNDIQEEELLIMNRRYHNKDLPVPYKRIMPFSFQKYYLVYFLRRMKKSNKKTLVFVPVIKEVIELVMFLRKFRFKVEGIHSKTLNSEKIIQQLKDNQLDVIVCTTILERGITIKDIQVIVYHCEHHVFDSRTLIQIAGRVGRKPEAYEGYVCFLSSYSTKEMNKCIYSIKRLNETV